MKEKFIFLAIFFLKYKLFPFLLSSPSRITIIKFGLLGLGKSRLG
jgi:hypothetical protein